MSKNSSPLDRLNIPAPCSADWDSMKGNDEVRFCSHCQLNVHNLSAMTRQEAMRFVARSEGHICIRYYRRPDQSIVTATAHQLHQLKRRASRLVAGAFTAALTVSAGVAAANAQTASSSSATASAAADVETSRPLSPAPEQNSSQGGATYSVTGTVTDPNGAVIPKARMTLTNQENNDELKFESDEEGKYRFLFLLPGTYTLKAESAGFIDYTVKDIEVGKGGAEAAGASPQVDVKMEVGVVVGGAVVIVSPRDTLVLAASKDDLAAVTQLINAGTNVNTIDEETNTTALAEAVQHNDLQMMRALLAAGAKVNLKNRYGQNMALFSLGDESTPEMFWTLMAAGAKLNQKDEDGQTVLMSIAGLENPELLHALIDAGAKIDARDKDGQTPLIHAAKRGSASGVRLLLQAGADVSVKDNEGHTALWHARENEDGTEGVRLLEAYGAPEY